MTSGTKADTAVTAALAALAEAKERLAPGWDEDYLSGRDRRVSSAEDLGFEERCIMGLGCGPERAGLIVVESEADDLTGATTWRLYHQPTRRQPPSSTFTSFERALGAALALVQDSLGIDWTSPDVWNEDGDVLAALVLRPFVEEEAVEAEKQARAALKAANDINCVVAWDLAGRPKSRPVA